jgi:hypothetical protein
VPERRRHEVDPAVVAQRARDLRALGRPHRPGRDLVRGEAHADRHAVARLGAHRGQDLAREAQARVEVAVVAVVAAIRGRSEELRGQVAVGHRDLDAVDPALATQAGARRVAGDELVDLGGGQRARLGVKARAGHRRRRDRRRPRRARDLLAPAVQQLHEQPRPVRADPLAEAAVRGRDPGQVAAERMRGEQPGRVHRGRLDEHRAGAAAGARLVVGDEVAGGQVVVDQAGLVRGRDDAIGERDRPERERLEQRGEGHRPTLPRRAAIRHAR